MKFDKKKLKEDFDKILGITKENAEKLWEGTLLLVDKGSKQYHILKLQKDIYFIQRKIEKLKHKLGDKVYKLYKKGKVNLDDVKPIGFDIDILLDEIQTIEDEIHKIKEEEAAANQGKASKAGKAKKAGTKKKSTAKKKPTTKKKSGAGKKATK